MEKPVITIVSIPRPEGEKNPDFTVGKGLIAETSSEAKPPWLEVLRPNPVMFLYKITRDGSRKTLFI